MSGSKDGFGGGRGDGGVFRSVTRSNPCIACWSKDNKRCSVLDDGSVYLCRNGVSEGAISSKQDRTGQWQHTHITDPNSPHRQAVEKESEELKLAESSVRASPSIINEAYELLLFDLTLSDFHRDLLLARGLTKSEIKERAYRSFPYEKRKSTAEKIIAKFGESTALGVPGIFLDKFGWNIAGRPGILVPLRNIAGQIVALKVRDDAPRVKKNKYKYVSSSFCRGPGALQSAHVPLGERIGDTFRVTEGEIKADIATLLSGIPTISVPGVSNWELALPVLRELKAAKVLVAFDADHNEKPLDSPAVALSLVSLCRGLTKVGLPWALELWDGLYGNGIDDVWQAGHSDHVRVVDGEDAEEYLAELAEKYTLKQTKQEAAEAAKEQRRIEIAEALAKREKIANAARPRVPLPEFLRTGDHHEMSELAIRLVRGRSSEQLKYDRDRFWRYDDASGLWKEIVKGDFWNELCRLSGVPVGSPRGEPFRVEVRHLKGAVEIVAVTDGIADHGFFDAAVTGVAFSDCFVEVRENGEIIRSAPSASHRATHGLPFPYDPFLAAPRWEKYLGEVFLHTGSEDRAARIAFIEEWLGATLLGIIVKHHICLALIGEEGNNGKSVMLHVMRKLVEAAHPHAVRSIPPRQWGNIFQLAALANCRLNVVNEMPESDVESGDTFKMIITGNEIDVAHKNRDPFTLRPRAGHAFAANALPGTKDFTGGFFRRWGIILFNRTFSGADKDVNLTAKLDQELPGIAARVILAAARLEARGGFALPESSIIAKKEWQLESDQVLQWIKFRTRTPMTDLEAGEKVTYMPSAYRTASSRAYSSYKAWAKDSGHSHPLSDMKFWKRLNKEFPAQEGPSNNFYEFRLPEDEIQSERSAAHAEYANQRGIA